MYKPIIGDECTCYKCQNIVVVKKYNEELKKLCGLIGFIPRQYDVSVSFNMLPMKFNKLSAVQPYLLTDALNKLKAIIETNNTRKFTPGRKPVYCGDCGRLHIKNLKLVYQGRYLCKSCFEHKYIMCSDCGAVLRREHSMAVFTGDGKQLICQTCYKKSYKKCQRCGNMQKKEKFKVVKQTHGDPLEVCPACAEQLCSCSECGDVWFKEYLHYYGPQRLLCNACMEDEIPIKEYMHKPNPIFQSNKLVEKFFSKDSLFMGLEYEVENCGVHDHQVAISRLKDIFGKKYFYCKKDSSIFNGFEIVTHPFSFDNFVARRRDWKDALTTLYALGFRDKAAKTDWKKTVGIHIHLTKRAFTAVHLFKFLQFMYNQSHRGFLIDLSERGKENFYAKFHPDASKLICKIAKNRVNLCRVLPGTEDTHQNVGDYDKNIAVNLKPQTTVEVRIFASTMHPISFIKNVEFCHALFMFSKDHSIKEMNIRRFLEYVMIEKAKTYKYLYTFIVSKMPAYPLSFGVPINYDFDKKGAI